MDEKSIVDSLFLASLFVQGLKLPAAAARELKPPLFKQKQFKIIATKIK